MAGFTGYRTNGGVKDMTVSTHERGHKTIWVYADTLEPVTGNRPCIRCGNLPTEEGYDACLGYIEGASSACCGHGITEPYIIFEDE